MGDLVLVYIQFIPCICSRPTYTRVWEAYTFDIPSMKRALKSNDGCCPHADGSASYRAWHPFIKAEVTITVR